MPGEGFFHTVMRNSPFCSTAANNNLKLINWRRDRGCKCQHKAYVDWCGCSPNDLVSEDWKVIEATKSEDLFFARKVGKKGCKCQHKAYVDWCSCSFNDLIGRG